MTKPFKGPDGIAIDPETGRRVKQVYRDPEAGLSHKERRLAPVKARFDRHQRVLDQKAVVDERRARERHAARYEENPTNYLDGPGHFDPYVKF
ncbi:MAG: hypothetical protein AAGK37_21860 [Pseudomonadota bacterium]